ncbi:hypothetical protein HRTV-25_gp79 [Halorubrum tailed virus 25]|uniref:Uncharacterized protein n=1 Tax=Halorubrum tailed virus 25 TaxID=2878006 RepID=A0AAE9BXL9_9CAUD|nr:hypothetical protein M1M37_gp079 [Halorubrum tailed virus 25]UBF22660.1 hypothetical protein HRTV-25_gp79 [Halorubrum tailed virus 25]
MGTQSVYTDDLVELYSMAKMFAENEDNQPLNERQITAIRDAEALIENNSGWKITRKFKPEPY